VRSQIKDIYSEDDAAPSASTPIVCEACGSATVKPSTVLFGSSLPPEFFSCAEEDMPGCDLLLVAVSPQFPTLVTRPWRNRVGQGTSLVVSPANSLPQMCIPTTRRAVVNREPVGMDLGLRFGDGRDSFVGGDCDEAFLELSARLGWLEELRESRACRCRAHCSSMLTGARWLRRGGA